MISRALSCNLYFSFPTEWRVSEAFYFERSVKRTNARDQTLHCNPLFQDELYIIIFLMIVFGLTERIS